METCFVYLRKSTDRKDKQQLSFEIQLKAINRILKKHPNLEVIGLDGNICDIPSDGFIYESASAKQGGKKRPEFHKMLEAINKYECDYVIVWKPSRISRNSDDMVSFLKLIENNKKIHKAIITKNGYYDVNNKVSISNLEIDLAKAKKDNSEISEGVKDSQEVQKSYGIWPYRFPFGYKALGDSEVKVIPEEMVLIRLAFHMRLKGCSFKEIADEFVKKGYNKDGGFIGEILSHQVYTGIFTTDDGEEKAITNPGFEVIIGPETFYKVQEYNEKHKRKHGTSNINKAKNQNSHYLDKMVFDVFGKALQPYKSNKTGKIYYRQSTKNYNYKINIGEQKLFDEMEEQINNYNLSDEILIILKESFLSKISILIEEQKSEIKYIKSEISEKEKSINDNIFEIGKIDDERLKKKLKEKLSSFEDKIELLEKQLKEKENTKINYEELINNYLELFKDLSGTYKKAPQDEKANILRGLGIKFIVGIDKSITIESDFLDTLKS